MRLYLVFNLGVHIGLALAIVIVALAGCAAKRPPSKEVVTYSVITDCWKNHELVCRKDHFKDCRFVPPLPAECQLVVVDKLK